MPSPSALQASRLRTNSPWLSIALRMASALLEAELTVTVETAKFIMAFSLFLEAVVFSFLLMILLYLIFYFLSILFFYFFGGWDALFFLSNL